MASSAPPLRDADLDGGFDFEAAVQAPFRMQPGLRRLAAGPFPGTPARPGSRHQREKLAVLTAYADEALQSVAGFDPLPALCALLEELSAGQPAVWGWSGHRAEALHLGTAVDVDGTVEQVADGVFGLGDEVARCLRGLPPGWRLPGLLALGLEEDLAIVEIGARSRLAWTAVCLPSFWDPREKIGHDFASVHAPVADGDLLRRSGEALMQLVTGPERWERFVWTVTPHPRLNGHPRHTDPRGWALTPVTTAWWRTERQSFLPVPPAAPGATRQALFAIRVQVRPLARALAVPGRAAALRQALASQTEAVRRYRGLHEVAAPLMQWLQALERDPPPGGGAILPAAPPPGSGSATG